MTTYNLKLNGDLLETKQSTTDLLNEFINFLELAPKTKESYRTGVNDFINYLNQNDITSVSVYDLKDYKNNLQARTSTGTTNIYINAVKRFYDFLELRGVDNLGRFIKGTKTSRNYKREALSVEQAKELINFYNGVSADDKRNNAIITLLLLGGLRTIEIVRANINDIRTLNGHSVLYIQGKGRTDKDEYINLTNTMLKAINNYLATRDIKKDSEPLFTSASDRNNGERLQTRTIRNIVNNAYKNIGIYSKNITTHSTRHTAISLALMSGKTLQEVKEYARHQNINTTLIYAHNINKLNSGIEEAIEQAINN